jgi:predicted nucleotidyltransferase
MKPSVKNEVLDYFVREMRERLGTHLKKIILFGSRARDDEIAKYDYDFIPYTGKEIGSAEIQPLIYEC